jgi:hypothetical protein
MLRIGDAGSEGGRKHAADDGVDSAAASAAPKQGVGLLGIDVSGSEGVPGAHDIGDSFLVGVLHLVDDAVCTLNAAESQDARLCACSPSACWLNANAHLCRSDIS